MHDILRHEHLSEHPPPSYRGIPNSRRTMRVDAADPERGEIQSDHNDGDLRPLPTPASA